MIEQIFLGFKMSLTEKHKIIDFAKTNNINCQILELSLDKTTFKLNHLRIYFKKTETVTNGQVGLG
jgi:hypothetical protein